MLLSSAFSPAIFSSASLQPGYVFPERKILCCSGVSGRVAMASYHYHDNFMMFSQHSKKLSRRLPTFNLKGLTFTSCEASSNSHRRNPDFSRQNKGFSRGRNRLNQDRENSESLEEGDILASKNGPLLSISNNPRYQATATPGQREKEIVELFRKVQAQLRKRAAIKEEKKIEASQQGQGEKGTVDSLLKLLRKHSVDQGKRSGVEEEFNMDHPERSTPFDEDQTSNFFEASSIAADEDLHEAEPTASTRPVSKFQRRSPVPRVKFQPVYSAVEEANVHSPSKATGKEEEEIVSAEVELEPVFFDEREEPYEAEPSDLSDIDDVGEDVEEPSSVENLDLSSMKLSDLRVIAKARGVKGYSKLKKAELVKLLEGM